MRRKLYTHALDTEPIGEREDGSTFERFEVVLIEDHNAEVVRLKKEHEELNMDYINRYNKGMRDGFAEGERRAMNKIKEAIEAYRLHDPFVDTSYLRKVLGLGDEEKK